MIPEDGSEHVYELGTEFEGEDGEHQETHEAAGENGQQEVRELHLGDGRRQREQLEGSGRRQHCGKHQAPEGMLLESLVKLIKALGGDALPQQLFATQISDAVNHDAAQRRSGGRHEHVQQEPGAILIHVGGNDRVHGQAERSAVEGGDHENPPGAQRLQQPPEERGVAQEYVLDCVQGVSLAVYANWPLV